MKSSTPSISVAIATYNSGKTLERCLRLIRSQNYPQENIEIILGDGGSKDDTKEIAKKYKAKVIKVPENKQHAEYNRGVAFNAGMGELSLIIDHDNFLPDKNWLKEMVKPLKDDKEIVASSTCYYHYSKSYDLMDRYFALFGTSEPLPYYLKKADRMPQTVKDWELSGKAEDKGDYYKVKFEKDARKFPSIGSNGCLMRRELVQKNAKADPDNHYPIDVLYDMVEKGFNTFAFVKTSMIHLTHSRGFFEFMRRRKKFVEKYHFQELSKRRWSVVMPGDGMGVVMFVIFSLTFIKPALDALKGFIKIRDFAWFVHPLMCFGTTIIYGWVTLRYLIAGKLIK